ncbi:Bet v1-like protein [Dioscorea alata]|uniref:Bet v1-like protein n=1 Tax=Dioscorea alata TaxID=55571 RepID=A0ACB7UNT1_DIOAL|nr:Bet v1-like protein [Dioscorea alata]
MMMPESHVAEVAGGEHEMPPESNLGQDVGSNFYQEMEDIDIMDTDEDELQRLLEVEFEDRTGSDNGEFVPHDEQKTRRLIKKRKYHRHSQSQIQEMEAFFRECPHPDDKQRKELSRAIGLDPLQIKFWFQNKRTQVKTQNERNENSHLRAENMRLSTENAIMKEVLSHELCTNCGNSMELGQLAFEGNDLRVENAKLRDEIERISSIAAKYAEKQPMISHQHSSAAIDGGVGIEKPVIIELAVAAMEEIVGMAQLCEPLWMSRFDQPLEILNEGIYIQNFSKGLGEKLTGFKTEATRETAVVPLNAVNIIEMLMDANQWMAFFPSIVSRAATLDVLSNGAAETFNGALQVMSAMFQMATPLVPSREGLFIRYCKQHAEKTWAVVDVSIDGLRPNSSLDLEKKAIWLFD